MCILVLPEHPYNTVGSVGRLNIALVIVEGC